MTQQIINIGALPSDGSGDPLRVSFDRINQNFSELYGALGGNTVVSGSGTVTSVAGKIGKVILTVDNIVGAVSQNYVDNKLSELVNSSVDIQFTELVDASSAVIPILHEMAAAVQSDPNFYHDITTQLHDKLSKTTGGTMTAPLLLYRDPESATEASTKRYVDSQLTYVDSQLTAVQSTLDIAKANKQEVYTKEEVDLLLLNITNTIDGNDYGLLDDSLDTIDDYGSL